MFIIYNEQIFNNLLKYYEITPAQLERTGLFKFEGDTGVVIKSGNLYLTDHKIPVEEGWKIHFDY